MSRRWNASVSAFVLVLAASSLSAEKVRFAVLGDTQAWGNLAVNPEVLPAIVREVLLADPPVQFVIVLGDLVTGAVDGQELLDQYQLWRATVDDWYRADFIGLKVYVLPGNHDLTDLDRYAELWRQAFPELPDNGPVDGKKLNYSFDVGSCHFCIVNTSAPGDKRHTVDLNWLGEDLANSKQPVKLVFGHEPAYKVDQERILSLDAYPDLRDQFWQLLAAKNVKAYFCGHDHTYDHWIKGNVHQIISGGGGGPGLFFHYLIVEADANDVTVWAYREADNQLFEQFKLSDTQGVADNDRTIYDNPDWPYNVLPCAVGEILFGFSLFSFAPILLGGRGNYNHE